MTEQAMVVRFARDGSPSGLELSRETEYRVTVDDGPWESFRSPWDEHELEELIQILRNTDAELRPEIERLEGIGRRLGDAVAGAPLLASRLQAGATNGAVVFWQLDYPELARLPWELTSWWFPPYGHVLLEPEMTFIRTVPLYHPRAPVGWPTGATSSLKVLFVWAETPAATVPHADHLHELDAACREHSVRLVSEEIRTVASLTELVAGGEFDFVHILAHGTRTPSGEWGLRLADEDATGEQIARALSAGDGPPALVTLAACDSANESSDSFGSVAYRIHARGIPMVLGSQFRLRKSVSTTSSAQVYGAVLGGRHPLQVLSTLRRQLSPSNDESWSNEVLYMNYSLDLLDEGAAVGRQQAALRKARSIARSIGDGGMEAADLSAAIASLQDQMGSLSELSDDGFDLPETIGLLASLARRIAYLRNDPPDPEELTDARDLYLSGLRADVNSLYCGVNALHLSFLLGDDDVVSELLPVVRFVAESRLADQDSDRWTWASGGEVAVYTGDVDAARVRYREFVKRGRSVVADPSIQLEEIEAAGRQLRQLIASASAAGGPTRTTSDALDAAAAALEVLDSAADRLGDSV